MVEPGCFVSYNHLPEFWYPVVIFLCNSGERVLERSTDLASWPCEQIFLPFTSVKGQRMVEHQPRCFDSFHNLPEFWYPVAIFPLIHCSSVLSGEKCSNGQQIWHVDYSSKFFDLLPQFKVLCFLSQLTWILLSGCISLSNLLFQSLIWRNVNRTVNRFGFLTVRAIFLIFYFS